MYRSRPPALRAIAFGAACLLSFAIGADSTKAQGADSSSTPPKPSLMNQATQAAQASSPAAPQTGQAPRTSGAAARQAGPPIASTRAFSLAYTGSTLMPSDFELGPLEDRGPERRRPGSPLDIACDFLDGLAAGKAPTDSLLSGREELILALLEPFHEASTFSGYRLGSFSQDLDAALFTLVLEARDPSRIGSLGRSRRARGELQLRSEGARWFIENISIDPLDLLEERSAGNPFDPSFADP